MVLSENTTGSFPKSFFAALIPATNNLLVVSVSSSQWGNYRGDIGNDTDHFKMVGVYGNKKQLADVGLFYLHVIHELQTMGY